MSGKRRRHISLKKRCAIFALALGDVPYNDAKLMTEDQILSLYQLDHNMLHSSKVKNTDAYWNYTPRLIAEHRAKTKLDAKVIAKSRRIRRKLAEPPLDKYSKRYKDIDWNAKPRRKIRSRGFDKTRRRTFRGKVVPR